MSNNNSRYITTNVSTVECGINVIIDMVVVSGSPVAFALPVLKIYGFTLKQV